MFYVVTVQKNYVYGVKSYCISLKRKEFNKIQKYFPHKK